MSGQSNSQTEALLASVSGLLDDLTALEESYRKAKEQKTADLASQLKRLAETSDTQAVRAHVLRELYWVKRVSAHTLAPHFGLTQGGVRKIAGKMVVELSCGRTPCANKGKFTFSSHRELESFEKKLSAPDGPTRLRCKECEELERRAREAEDHRRTVEYERRAEEQHRRAEMLVTLPWPKFIETSEWAEARNTAIDGFGYSCEACKSGGVSLYVYLAKGHPQYSAERWFKLSGHLHVLCADCLPRLAGLLEEQKYELVKKEFFGQIKEWVRDSMMYPSFF